MRSLLLDRTMVNVVTRLILSPHCVYCKQYYMRELRLQHYRTTLSKIHARSYIIASMAEREFTKLFKYMQGEFKKINDRLEQTATKHEIDRPTNAVDAYAKQAETYMEEMLALSHKVDRLERWILKVAEATGVKLLA